MHKCAIGSVKFSQLMITLTIVTGINTIVAFSQSRLEAALQVAQMGAPFPSTFPCSEASAPELITPRIFLFDTIDSTNRALWDVFDENLPEGSLAIATQQTAGKGQWGRQWTSAPGGLYLSIALTPNISIDHSAQLTLCTAWGIAIALEKIPSRLSGTSEKIPVRLKWLNDLVIDGRKLGGILTETRVQNQRIHKAVVGVGLNWTNPVPEPGINLQTVLENQTIPLIESLEMLAAITIVGLIMGYQRWKTLGIDAILPHYLDQLINLGQTVTVGEQTGTIVGVLPTGELQVRLCNFDESEKPTPDLSLKPGTICLGYY
jgi:BirA family biotin operon repressor/biotin-[acetyl-CoA-carboxylase] ligase